MAVSDNNAINSETTLQIYVRSGNSWTHQGTLSESLGAGSNEQLSLALSSNGNTLAVGMPGIGARSDTAAGGVQIYTRLGTNWNLQATFMGSHITMEEGISVSLSGDGTILAAGSPGSGTAIYAYTNAAWSYVTTVTQMLGGEGSSVALSSDGTTLAAGAPTYKYPAGATQIYIQTNNQWSYQATLTQAGVGGLEEGTSVALSADGTILAAGAAGVGTGIPGAIQMYIRSGTKWFHVDTMSQKDNWEGYAVAMSADGSTVAVGNPIFNQHGIVYVYDTNSTLIR